MQVKKFEAPTMQEALKVIKRELGPEAIILSTKHIKSGFGLMSKASVEVTAAIADKSLKKKMAAEKAQFEKTQLNDLRNRTNTLHESTFGGGFTIHYPILWSSEHNNNEIVLLSPHETSTPEWSVRIYEDIKASSIPDSKKRSVVVGGREALRYDVQPSDGSVVSTIEIKLSRWNTLHIEGSGPEFETIVQSLVFD
jgi:hypothetical protein